MGGRSVSPAMAFRVARFVRAAVDDVLAGRFPAPGTSPPCGHAKEGETTNGVLPLPRRRRKEDEMKQPSGWVTVLMALALGCGVGCSSSSSSSGDPPLVGTNWLYTDSSGTGGTDLTINSDNSYELSLLYLTSSTSAEAQTETGTVAISGSSITFTPQKWSCEEPTDPSYTAGYQFNGSSLEVVFTSGLVAFQADTSSASTGTGFQITLGCFPQSGGFVASPLEPIGSCSAYGATCSASTVCCLSGICITTAAGSNLCAATCTTGSQCESGCCNALSNDPSQSVCAPCADGGSD
jgi:hypothetical protein